MPEWIHNRAEHLLSKNPSMPKHMAFAIATQQSHAIGKSPKGYGTSEGRRTAKSKFTTPKDDVKKANPGNLSSSKLATISDTKLFRKLVSQPGYRVAKFEDRVQNLANKSVSSRKSKLQRIADMASGVLEEEDARNTLRKQGSVGKILVTIMRKVAGAGVGAGFTTSQYSGPLSYGGFKQTSGIPSFTAPSPTKVDPSLEAKTAALTSPTGAMSAGAKLHASQSIGAPKVSAPPGPSIAEVSKPKGFGKPLSGALKNRL